MTATLTTKQKYKERKLSVQSQLPLGSEHVYPVDGAKRELRGKKVTVVAYESQGGIIVECEGKRYPVSPFVLLRVRGRR